MMEFDRFKLQNDTFIYALSKDGTYKRAFGKGIAELLRQIDISNSIHAACSVLGLSYTKAMHMINRAEELLSVSLLERRKGGSERPGSKLSECAKCLLDVFDQMQVQNSDFAKSNSIKFFEKLKQFENF